MTLMLAGITTGAVGTHQANRASSWFSPCPPCCHWRWPGPSPAGGGQPLIGLAMASFLLAYLGILISLAKAPLWLASALHCHADRQWRLNRDLRQALNQAEEANAAKTRFLASVATTCGSHCTP